MKTYRVTIAPEAFLDIQEIRDWYNEAQPNLGKRFQKVVIQHINALTKNPEIYAVR